MITGRTHRTRHARHIAETRRWQRETQGRDWQLGSFHDHDGQRVYVWVKPIPGSRDFRYLAFHGLDASVAVLHLLRVALAQHREAIDHQLMAIGEEIPHTDIMMV